MRPYIFVSMILALCFVLTGFSYADNSDIIVSTGELPPYSYSKEDNEVGIANTIVREIMRRTNSPGKIEVLPWIRAIKKSSEKNRITFPLARLPYREDKYQWIGPILKDSYVFCSRKDFTQKNYNDLSELRMLSIGVNRGAPTEDRLIKSGFTSLQKAPDEKTNVKMLFKKRIDAWYSTRLMTKYILKNMNIEEDRIRTIFTDIDIEMYIVASLDLKSTALKWQKALDGMKADGSYERLLKNYGIGGALE